jgi:DAK2 domain fusion protein YloV
MPDPSLVRFRAVMEGALAQLEERRQEVNDLNVFPVADGDTGDNMALTLRAVLDELDSLSAQGNLDEIGRDQIVDSVARAALLGARGNSGVILSQLIRGAAEELISRPGELVDPVLLGAAMARAADRAYSSVRSPAEGTILTVMREMAHRVASEVAHMERPRLREQVSDVEQDDLLAGVLEGALDAGRESVQRGPDLLPVLREAGVVDAGGHGLTIIVAGVIAALRGAEAPEIAPEAANGPRVTHPEHESSTYRYCVNFAVIGDKLRAADWRGALEKIGDSVLVVGDAHTLRVHVHTDEPAAAEALFGGIGTVSRWDVADMHQQVAARAERLTGRRCGLLAVASGEGMKTLFRSLNAVTLDGGPTLNPSTFDLLAAIHGIPSEEVVVLPNSGNVLMAAERAAGLSDKVVRVVATRSQQAGLVAALALDPGRSAAENACAMTHAIEAVRTGGVTAAARDDPQARFRRGEAVGFIEDELVTWGEPAETLEAIMGELARDGAELLTCIAGSDPPLESDAIAALAPAGVELELSEGGQSSWWWLLSAE